MTDEETPTGRSSSDAGAGSGANGNDEAYNPDIVAQLGTSTGSDASGPERSADFGDASSPTSLGVSDGLPADLAREEKSARAGAGGDEGAT